MDTPFIVISVILFLLFLYYKTNPCKQENFMIMDLKNRLIKINEEFKNLDIREGSSSYTEDKTIIYLCLRDEHGSPYSYNTLIYVVLHEIAHLLNKDNYGHTKEFYDIFNKLLCRATELDVYDPNEPHDNWYCGVDISNIEMPQCELNNNISTITLE